MSDAFEDQARGPAHSIPEAEISICKELRASACPETHVLIEAADMIECMGNRQRWAEKRAEAAEAERDRLEAALKEISEADDVDLMLDPSWAKRIALAALSSSRKQGE